MNKRIYFHIDELARDAVVGANLRHLLAEHGVDVVFGNKKVSEWYLDKCRDAFDAVILPKTSYYGYCHKNPDEPFPPVITLLTEAAGALSSSPELLFRNIAGEPAQNGDTRWVDTVAAFCLWGDAQLDVIKQHAESLVDRCHVVGQPRLDSRCLRSSKTLRSDGRTKVGYISKLASIMPYNEDNIFTIIQGMIDSNQRLFLRGEYEMEDLIYTAALDMRVFLQFAQQVRDDVDVFIRPHPRESFHAWERLIKEHNLPITLSPWDQPFCHWASDMDYVIGPPSTSYYDCLASGKYPVCLSHVDARRLAHAIPWLDAGNELNRHLVTPESLDELTALVMGEPDDHNSKIPQKAMDILHEEANFVEGSTALTQVVDVCLKVLKDSPTSVGKARRELSFLKFKWYLKKYNGYLKRRIKRGKMHETSNSFCLDQRRDNWLESLVR